MPVGVHQARTGSWHGVAWLDSELIEVTDGDGVRSGYEVAEERIRWGPAFPIEAAARRWCEGQERQLKIRAEARAAYRRGVPCIRPEWQSLYELWQARDGHG